MILLNFKTEIKGTSEIEKHIDWIEVSSMQFGVGRGISQAGKDRETSNPSFSEVTLGKAMDKSSTELFMQATCGKSLGDATIHFIQTGGADAKGQYYLEYILGEAIVSGYSIASGGDRPEESFTLSFLTLSTKYNTFKDGAVAQQGASKGWDLTKNEQAQEKKA